MAVPNIFGTATAAIPLSQLDQNFATAITLGNTAVYLGNTTTSLGNVTLTNVTISSGNVTLTGANVSGTANVSALVVTGNAVISVTDNTNAALRITQLGTGNALLVEDSTNPDSTPVVIDATGRFVVGHTAAIGAGQNTNIQSQGTSGSAGVSAFRWSDDVTPPRLQVGKSRGATVGTNAIVQSGDQLGGVYFYGDDGTDIVSTGASIIAEVDGTPGTNDMPGRLVFATTADGASTPTEAMRIDSSQKVGIGTTTPVTKLEIAGDNNTAWTNTTTSISGTTMTVVGTVTGTSIAVGDLVFASGIQPYTRVTALGTGTGGAGTYTVSVSQTFASAAVFGTAAYGNTIIRITDTDTSVAGGQPNGALQFYTSDASSPTAGVGAYVAGLAEQSTPDTALVFGTRDNGGGGIDANERMRIDSSGNLLVGGTSVVQNSKVLSVAPLSTKVGIVVQNSDVFSGTMYFEGFVNSAGNLAGYIAHTGTTTVSYTSVSDYRLKENVVPMSGALSKVQALKPCTYKWKSDGTSGQGFIAHELQEIIPDCVVGNKDAVDSDGNPKYQGIDTSFLVATLTAAIQEQQATITALTARITALETP